MEDHLLNKQLSTPSQDHQQLQPQNLNMQIGVINPIVGIGPTNPLASLDVSAMMQLPHSSGLSFLTTSNALGPGQISSQRAPPISYAPAHRNPDLASPNDLNSPGSSKGWKNQWNPLGGMVDSKLASSSISNLSPELLLLQQNNLYSTFPFVSTSLQANFNSLNTATQQNNPPGSLHHLPFAQSSLTQKPPIVFNQTMRQIGQIGQIASKSIILAPKPQYTGAGLEVIQQSITESKKRSFDESQSLASSSDDGGKRGRKSAGNKWQREALAQRSEAGSSSGQANQAMAFRLFLKDEQSKGVVSLENVDESSDPKLNPLGLKMWEVHNVDQWWKDVHSWFEDNPERFSLRAFFMMLRRLGYKPLNHAPAPATSGLDYGLRNRFVKKHGYVYDKDVFEKYQRRRGLKKLPEVDSGEDTPDQDSPGVAVPSGSSSSDQLPASTTLPSSSEAAASARVTLSDSQT